MKKPFTTCDFREYPAGSITQYFGENPKLYEPLGMKAHNGVDLVAPHGTPLLAVEDGTVLEVKNDAGGYGRHVRFISAPVNGVCNEWTYGHCDTINVEVGDTILAGEQIATMGNTGFVVSEQTPFWSFNPYRGTHLHLGLRKVKRSAKGWSYPNSNIKIVVQNSDNGYKGAVDPLPFFKVHTTPDIAKLETTVTLLQKVVELYKQLKALKK